MNADTSVPSAPPALSGRAVADCAPAWLRLVFAAAGLLAPDATAQLIAYRMFRPRRRRDCGDDFGGAKPERGAIAFDGRDLATYVWHGGGPTVLLVHGWEGATADFAGLIAALSAAGFRLIAFDAPAHGASAGHSTDVHDIARSIRRMVSHFGQPAAIVAHSIGAAATAVYLSELTAGAKPGRLVLLAPGGDLDSEIARITDALGIPPRAAAALRIRVEQRYGRPASECSTRKALSGIRIQTLVIHDESDRIVPIAESERLAYSMPTIRLLRTRGLGHRKLLRDAGLIRSIVDFIGRAT